MRFAHSEGSEQCWLALESKSQKMEIELRSSMVMQSSELSSGKNHCNQETDTQLNNATCLPLVCVGEQPNVWDWLGL